MTLRTVGEIGFPPAEAGDWEALVRKAANARSPEQLATRSEDGFFYGPLEQRRTDAVPISRATALPWTIMQRVDDPDTGRARRQILTDLEGGAEGLAIAFEGSVAARGFGVALTPEALADLLSAADLTKIRLRLEAHVEQHRALALLGDVMAKRNADPASVCVDSGIDPLTPFLGAGRLAGEPAAMARSFAGSIAEVRRTGLNGRLIEADGRLLHDAGATTAQELGAMLSVALWSLRSLTDGGIDVTDAAPLIGFTLSADQRQFETSAKIRALRLLWSKILEECGITESSPVRIHAETSSRMMSANDPDTNIVRATIATFAAAVGGADTIAVLPHTVPLGLAAPSARRLARNIQLILREESHLARVGDPAAGAGGLEALTQNIAAAGWGEFIKIETEGGIMQSVIAGTMQSRILDAATVRESEVRSGDLSIVGVNLYPEQADSREEVLLPRSAGETDGFSPAGATGPQVEALRPSPLSAHWEASL